MAFPCLLFVYLCIMINSHEFLGLDRLVTRGEGVGASSFQQQQENSESSREEQIGVIVIVYYLWRNSHLSLED
jgi:hypothetical protein